MKMIAKHATEKQLTNNILSIAVEAYNAKQKNNQIIDATIGTMNDENGNIIEFGVVDEVIKKMSFHDKYAYSSTDGGEEFKKGIAKWTLRKNFEAITKNMHYEVIATPGGSGAISATLANYLNQGDSVLVSDVYWAPYAVMIKEHFLNIETYNMFENGKFDIDSFKKKIINQAEKQKRVFVIINDPCHNPTGYGLEDSEWKEIINCLNSINKDIPVVLLYDMAYIDYSHKGIEDSRDVFKEFLNFNENVLAIMAFSGSKTFSLYGLRVGAMMCLTKNKETAEDFFRVSEFSARGYWSNTPRIGINLVARLMNDEDKYKRFSLEIKNAAKLLLSRSTLFLEEAKQVDLPMLPYKSGFFITIPCAGMIVFEKLKSQGIYVVPLKNGIRVSLSAISLNDTHGLAAKIKRVL